MKDLISIALGLVLISCGPGPELEDDEPGLAGPNVIIGTRPDDDSAGDDDPTDDSAPDTDPIDDGDGDGDEPTLNDAGIIVSGRRLLLDGETFLVKGVCWSPAPRGAPDPSGVDFAGFAALDSTLMREAGINAVRTYGTITDTDVLDTLYANGVYVLNTVYIFGGDSVDSVDARVNAVKDHPAILMWVVGNEWNYNGYYAGLSFEESVNLTEAVAVRIQTLDSRPVMVNYGEMPSARTIADIPSADVWSLNVYRFNVFGDLFSTWRSRSTKPMLIGEYGADAYNANLPGVDTASQAQATRDLTQLIIDNYVTQGGVASGGLIFEFSDEWWKDETGSPNVHDTGGIAPGGGPFPDGTFNEEWWGIVDIDRNPRPAFDELKSLYTAQ